MEVEARGRVASYAAVERRCEGGREVEVVAGAVEWEEEGS